MQAVCGQHPRPRTPSLSPKGNLRGASYIHHKELQEDFLEEGVFHLGGTGVSKERIAVQAKETVCKTPKGKMDNSALKELHNP